METTKWGGAFEIPNDTDRSRKWPDKSKLLEARKINDFGFFCFCYRCEVSNHGAVNLFDVAIPMRFWFGNKGGEENAVKFAPVISPLDVEKASVLYFVNDCPVLANGILPDDASVIVAGETVRRSTKLNLPERNPVDRIMMWFPTKVIWVGSTQCE
jgi:hypothetical protein